MCFKLVIITVFWGMIPCRMVDRWQCFRWNWCPHLGEMQPASHFIMLVPIYQTTQHHTPVDCNLNICYFERLISHLLGTVSFAGRVFDIDVHNATVFITNKTLHILISVLGSRWRYQKMFILSESLSHCNFRILLRAMFEFPNFCQWSATVVRVIPNQHSPP